MRNRLVAFCDILGFRDLVASRDLDVLLAHDLSVFRRLLSFCLFHEDLPALPPSLSALQSHGRIGFTWFSDTVLLYTREDDDESCRELLEAVGWLLFTTMKTPVRLRAGIAYGGFAADPEAGVFVGPALVEAYDLEREQAWSGAALTDSAAARVPPRRTTGERFQWWLCEYAVPLKPGAQSACSGLAIDWTQGSHKFTDFPWSRQHAVPTEEEQKADPGRYLKWRNTKTFHEEVCVRCFPGNRGRDPLKVL